MRYSSLWFRIISNSCLRLFHAYIYYKHQLVNYSIAPKKGKIKKCQTHLTLKQWIVQEHIAKRNVNIICFNVLSCLNHQKRKKKFLLKYWRAHAILVSHFLSIIFFLLETITLGYLRLMVRTLNAIVHFHFYDCVTPIFKT